MSGLTLSHPLQRHAPNDAPASNRSPARAAFGVAILSTALGTLLLAAPALAAGKDAEIRRHPGFIDGSAFARLAGDDAELVEVNIGPSLLKAIARGAAKDREAASVLSGLLNVSAYIVGLEGDPAAESHAKKMIADIVETLDRSGWERLVKVREKNEMVNVYIRNDDEVVSGLVVLVFDRDDDKVVFANLVGTIDLAKIGELDGALDIPGLDALDDAVSQGPAAATPPPSKSHGSKRSQPSPPNDDGSSSRGDDQGDQP